MRGAFFFHNSLILWKILTSSIRKTIFQEYDPPSLGDYNNMDWKRSRPTKWWISLWKAIKCVVLIQLLGGLAVGLFAIGIVVLELNSVDLCYELQHQNWTSVPKKI